MRFSGFGVLFLVLVLLYLRYDKTGYYYGVECSFCNKNMPYGLTPKSILIILRAFVYLMKTALS